MTLHPAHPAIASIGLALVAAALAAGGLGWFAAAASVAAAAGIGFTLFSYTRRDPRTPEALFERVRDQAESGRRLVIYERETGLLAHWYVALRAEEECRRAVRYERALAMAIIEPAETDEPWPVKDRLASWILRNVRSSDIAGYFGNGRFLVVMPETQPHGIETLLQRLHDEIPSIVTSRAVFPDDGETWDTLYATVTDRLAEAVAA